MEWNGSGFPYNYHHHHDLLHLVQGPGEAGAGMKDGGESSGVLPSSSSSSAIAEGGGNPLFPHSAVTPASGRASALSSAPAVEPARRKRGRPRKYGRSPSFALLTSSSAASSFSAHLSTTSAFGMNNLSSSPSLPLAPTPPPRLAPCRKKAQHECVGKSGQSFTPHILTVAEGEDVVQQIMSFVQQQKRAVCIISASGSIANVTLRQPAMSGGHVTYEGHFDIVSLSGSFLLTESGGAYSRTGALSVCLSDEGCVVGGGVSGPLLTAGPVQVIAGSFLIGSDKNLAAPARMDDTLSDLSTLFSVGTNVSSLVGFQSTTHTTGRVSTNCVRDDNHDFGSGHSFILQARAVQLLPSKTYDAGVRQDKEHLGTAYRFLEGDDEHVQD